MIGVEKRRSRDGLGGLGLRRMSLISFSGINRRGKDDAHTVFIDMVASKRWWQKIPCLSESFAKTFFGEGHRAPGAYAILYLSNSDQPLACSSAYPCCGPRL
jgi:hypothetical protein